MFGDGIGTNKLTTPAKPFEDVAPPVSPAWSPVAHFGGYQHPKKAASLR
jgi:hypothetical protein